MLRILVPLTLLLSLSIAAPARGGLVTVNVAADPALPAIAPFGAVGPLAIGGALNQPFASPAGANHFFSGRVLATNVGGVLFTLTLTDLEYRSDVAGPFFVTIRIQQDYAMAFPAGIGNAAHSFDGNAVFNGAGQIAEIHKISTHEGNALPPLASFAFAGAGPYPEIPALAAAGAVGPFAAANAYSIDTTYTFDVGGGAGGGAWVSVRLPSSGEDIGQVSSVPEPASLTLAAIGGIGLLGFSWRYRGRA